MKQFEINRHMDVRSYWVPRDVCIEKIRYEVKANGQLNRTRTLKYYQWRLLAIKSDQLDSILMVAPCALSVIG